MNNIKKWVWLGALLLAATTAGAQTKSAAKTADYGNPNNSFDIVHNDNGNTVEKIQMERDGKLYRAVLVNNKMTELYIDDEKIPAADWDKYHDAIEAINAQLVANRIQAKKNAEQAKLNELQAKKNQEQAARNKEQAKRNQEQQVKNEKQAVKNREQDERNVEQVEKNKEQAVRNEEQVKLNKEQEKRNAEQAIKNQEQDKRNAEQVERNKEQAVKNEEQAKLNKEQEKRNAVQAVKNKEQERLNAIQAKKNQKQAEANERFMKEIAADLAADKIIPDASSLKELKFDNEEMIVNGVKQPDTVRIKYAEKYHDELSGNKFSFSDN